MREFIYLIAVLFLPLTAYGTPLENIQAVMFDMEGVLKTGSQPIEGASELIKWMNDEDIPGFILTNEDQYTTEEIRSDLDEMNIFIPESWILYSAAEALKDFIDHKLVISKDSYVLVVGEEGLKTTVTRCLNPYIHVVDKLPDSYENKDPLFIVVGTVRELKVSDLDEAKNWIDRKAKVLLTCPDLKAPGSSTSFPQHILDILTEKNNPSVYSTGKPNPLVVNIAVESLRLRISGLKNENILFIGDTIDTDIKAAFESGLQSALVLSGNTDTELLQNSIIQPDFVFSDVGVILSTMQKSHISKKKHEIADR
jgi:HAD superfamily hydrolase (TIGR01450 family)